MTRFARRRKPIGFFGATSDSAKYRVTAGNPLPRGMAPISAGLLILGLTTYGFLGLASRSLDEVQYSAFAVFWGLLFILGPSLFQPLEQELTRATAERAEVGDGSAPVLWRSAGIGFAIWVGVCALLPIAWMLGLDELFDGDISLLIALGAALGGWALLQIVRGVIAGRSLFGRYAFTLGAEGVLRVAAGGAVVLLGWSTMGTLGAIVGASFAVSALVTAAICRPLVRPGPPATWKDVTPKIGWLLIASICEATLLNVGPVVVAALSNFPADAGRFLNGLVVARIPVFLFQGVKASLLPALTTHAAAGNREGFLSDLRRLLLVLAAGTVAAGIGFALLGPWIVETMFATSIGGRDMALLAVGNGISMMAVSLGLGLIALDRSRRTAFGWLTGMVAFVLALALPGGVFLRVEVALIAATSVATIFLGVSTLQVVRKRWPSPQPA